MAMAGRTCTAPAADVRGDEAIEEIDAPHRQAEAGQAANRRAAGFRRASDARCAPAAPTRCGWRSPLPPRPRASSRLATFAQAMSEHETNGRKQDQQRRPDRFAPATCCRGSTPRSRTGGLIVAGEARLDGVELGARLCDGDPGLKEADGVQVPLERWCARRVLLGPGTKKSAGIGDQKAGRQDSDDV